MINWGLNHKSYEGEYSQNIYQHLQYSNFLGFIIHFISCNTFVFFNINWKVQLMKNILKQVLCTVINYRRIKQWQLSPTVHCLISIPSILQNTSVSKDIDIEINYRKSVKYWFFFLCKNTCLLSITHLKKQFTFDSISSRSYIW